MGILYNALKTIMTYFVTVQLLISLSNFNQFYQPKPNYLPMNFGKLGCKIS